ncbi:hypothetical protein GCM10025771_11190 [Niveibacterium umoris]
MGQQAAQSVASDIGLVDDPALIAYVDSVGQRVAAALPKRQFNYHFSVVDQVEPNAFAVPGGYIYVSRGLLALIRSEDELAGVLGHEIQHVERRHSVRQMKKEQRLGLLALPGELVGGIISDDLAVLASKPFQAVAAGYSRDQEREADALGQPLAAAAGYNPLAIATILDRMEHFIETMTDEKRAPTFFDSHPSTPERVGTLTRTAASLTAAPLPRIAADEAALMKKLDGLLVGPDPAEGVVHDETFLHPDLGFRMVFPKGWLVENTRKTVNAMAPTKDGVAVFGLAGEGSADDLPKIAKAFSEKLARKYRATPQQIEATTANGLPARALYLTDKSGKEAVHLYFLWVVLGKNIYQMIGLAPDHQKVLVRGIADSLRPLNASERASITELRLQILAARSGEAIPAVNKRAGGTLAAALVAAMNGVGENVPFKGGELVKVPVRKPYRSPR